MRTFAFVDNFTVNPLHNPNWVVENANGLYFGDNFVRMSSTQSKNYPYFHTSAGLDFSSKKYFEIEFQYENQSPWGAGGAITDNIPTYGTSLPEISDYLFYTISYFWGNGLHVVSSLCPDTYTNITCNPGRWVVYPSLVPVRENFSSLTSDLNRHILSVEREDHLNNIYSYRIYMDNVLRIVTMPTTRKITGMWFGHPTILQDDKDWSTFKIYSVKALDHKNEDIMSFPYLSQNDSKWKDLEYDTASIWAPNQNTIGRWGCALTSVAMILNKYNVKMPTGEVADPELLNAWLKSQPDGYVGDGLLNWLAISRLAHESRMASKSPTDLEFEKSTGTPEEELASGKYPIINEGGHFVVTTKDDGTTYAINDPNNAERKSKDKNSTIVSVNTFKESSTNLSYMLFVTDPGINLILNGPAQLKVFDENISSDYPGGVATKSKKLWYAQLPPTAQYQLTVENTGIANARIEAYLYDKVGVVSSDVLNVPAATKANFGINYSQEPDQARKMQLNVASIMTYLKELRVKKTPANGIYQAVYSKFSDLLSYLGNESYSQMLAQDLSNFVVKQKTLSATEKTTIQNYIYLITTN